MQHSWERLSEAEEDLIAQGIMNNRAMAGPFNMLLFPTDRCNFDCFFCNRGYSGRMGITLKWDILHRALEEARKAGLKGISLSGGGEPMIYPQIDLLLDYLHHHGIQLYSINTNGTPLTEQMVSRMLDCDIRWITVSLNETQPNEHAEITRTSPHMYAKAIEGIETSVRLARQRGATAQTRVQIFIWKKNFRRLIEMLETTLATGADFIYINSLDHLCPEDRMNPEEQGELKEIITDAMHRWAPQLQYRLVAESHDLQMHAAVEQHQHFPEITVPPDMCKTDHQVEYCYVGWYMPLILPDGSVFPCCALGNNTETLCGNLHDQSLSEIWNGPKYQEFRTSWYHMLMTQAERAMANRKNCQLLDVCFERGGCPFNYYLASPEFYHRIDDWANSGPREKYLRRVIWEKRLGKLRPNWMRR